MITTKRVNSRTWEWTVTDPVTREHLAGGYAGTKRDAESDAKLWYLGYQIDDARRRGDIAPGDRVKFKPEWQDAGDAERVFIAVEVDTDRILVRDDSFNGLIKPTQRVSRTMLVTNKL